MKRRVYLNQAQRTACDAEMFKSVLVFTIVFILNLIITTIVFPARAQDNVEAGLFCEARQLPVIAHGIHVDVHGSEATVSVEQVFHNNGADIAQADYRLHLPTDAQITEFGFWNHGKYLKAALKAREDAKADHERAAREGRTTGILHKEGNMQHFSVYPLGAGEHKRIRIVFTLPVVSELGKNQVRIPVDSFLGQGALMGVATVRIGGDRPIVSAGAMGAETTLSATTAGQMKMMLNVNQPFELWWKEVAVPLSMNGSAVALDNGTYAVALKVAMDEWEGASARPRNIHVFVDGSFSMKHKLAETYRLVSRMYSIGKNRMKLTVIAESARNLTVADSGTLARQLADVQSGHALNVEMLKAKMASERCDLWENQCILMTDLQMVKQLNSTKLPASVIWLADVHEKAFFEADLNDSPGPVHVIDVDSQAHLDEIADELLLPVLQLRGVSSAGEYHPLSGQKETMALGGRLVYFGTARSPEHLEVAYAIDNRFSRTLDVELAAMDDGSVEGKRLRSGYYGTLLKGMMSRYRETPDEALKTQIIETSLREGIPTVFTSLHVDDPSLSLFSMKPGDPILTVHHEHGLKDVLVAYPFGEVKRLVFDKTTDTWTDRFLVPRGWRDQSYRVAVFKRFEDGTVQTEYVYYQIDRTAPTVAISYTPDENLLRVVPEFGGAGIGSVQLHLSSGKVLDVTPVDGVFMLAGDPLDAKFELRIRDRAGNTLRSLCRKEDWVIECAAAAGGDLPGKMLKPGGDGRVVPLMARGRKLEVAGDIVTARLGDDEVRFSLQKSKLNSLHLTAFARGDDGRVWVGTQLGDVLQLSCGANPLCDVTRIAADFYGHAVTGIVAMKDGPVTVGVIGKGIYQVKNGVCTRYRVRAKSRYVTGIAAVDGTLYYGTLKSGLYQIKGGRGMKTGLPQDAILGLDTVDSRLVVDTPSGRYVRETTGKFAAVGHSTTVESGSPDITAATVFGGKVLVAGFDGGLMERTADGSMHPLPLALSVMERRINALAVVDDVLYMGTEGGLLKTGDLTHVKITEITGAVHDLAVDGSRLAVASAKGLFIVTGEKATRLDYQKAGKGRFATVAFWKNRVVAGNIDGLFWFENGESGQYGSAHGFDGSYVTALAVKDDALYVGTYDMGVYTSRDGKFAPVVGLAHQWVPPRGLRWIENTLWVGGMGMPVKRGTDAKNFESIHVPVRDVNDFYPLTDGTLLLTSDGVVVMRK
jgi:hypothetical protein